MIVKFWGVRGSIPAPISSAEIEEKILAALTGARGVDLSDRHAIKEYVSNLPPLERGTVGGNTPCVSVQVGDEWIILDAGSGIRELGWELLNREFGRGRGVAHIFMTHTHWDHIQGLPFFMPAFTSGNRITIYSPVPNLQQRFRGQQVPEYFPISLDYARADISFVQLEENVPITIAGVQINNILQAHPGRSYGYRLDGDGASIIYATDAEYKDLGEAHTLRYVEFMQGADLLIFDAMYTFSEALTKLDWGHSSSMIGVDMAVRANVKRIVLFHFDPTYTDAKVQEILDSTLNYVAVDPAKPQCQVEVAIEGLEFEIGTPERTALQDSRIGDAVVLSIQGRFDAGAVNKVDERLTALISDGPEAGIVVDMSAVTHLNVAGLKTLITAQQRGQRVPLVMAAAPQNVQDVLQEVGFGEAFIQYDTVEEAVNALEARQYLQLRGQTLHGRYRIDSKLALTPKGAVFKAFDTWFERMVTVKALPQSRGEGIDKVLLREARAVAHLNHPNIASVYDCIEYREQLYLVREFVEGCDLRDQLRDLAPGELFPSRRVLAIIGDVLRALAYAHEQGVLHCYLRPKNIIFSENAIKIINFGMPDDPEEKWSLSKVSYMAPEQINRDEPDERADLYSVGIIFYQLVTGSLPFAADTVEDLIRIRMHRDPMPLRDANPHIPLPLERIILTLLSKSPDHRYPSATMVLDALRGIEPWDDGST
jgi:anti-anti-sigma factor